MRFVSHFFYRLRGRFSENRSKNKLSKLEDGEYRLSYSVPYVCQYASPEMAERFVESDDFLRGDPKWREPGAETIDEYIFWAPKLCGMACFSMMVNSLRPPRPKLIELGKKAMAAGCYEKDPQNPKRLIGMLHAPFLKFARDFEFEGKLLWYIGENAIATEILKNNFIIASVSNQIRHAGATPENKQGHLVLIHGFRISGGEIEGFYIHNPSGFFNESQENHFVVVNDFTNCFSGRIIVLWEKNFQSRR